ncbi:Putative F-box protein At3g58860 [Linum perenne]
MSDSSASEDKLTEEELDYTLKLPDELVVKCMSWLTLKEAVRTSAISKRWINLWKSVDLVLDFDVLEELNAIYFDPKHRYNRSKMERAVVKKFLWLKNRVNAVMEQLARDNNEYSLKVVKFRVAVCLLKGRSLDQDIDRWLEIAISKRVESLHLDFYVHNGTPKGYIFSEDCYNHMKTPAGLSQIKSLRSLHLRFVGVKDEIVEHIVANCPLLEELVFFNIDGLKKLRLVGSSDSPLPLKRLEITCHRVELLEIAYAPHLVQLTYGCNVHDEFRLDENLSLVNLTLALHVNVLEASELLRVFSGYASQLRFLSVKIPFMAEPLFDLPEYTCLERLAIKTTLGTIGSHCILGLIPLINKCPRLHTLQAFFYNVDFADKVEWEMINGRDFPKTVRESVKVVEISGFSGYEMEVEFVEYVMEYFVGLERIKIDRSLTTLICDDDPLNVYMGKNRCRGKQARMAKDIALEFKSKASPAIEFIVI